jgi:type III restriction enzyme
MATGSGKTVAMAMLIAWQILNKISKYFLIVAPKLTVKRRPKVLLYLRSK